MENKTKSGKTKVIIFSRSPLVRKSEPILKLYGERLKIYPQVKFLGITFDSKLTLQKHFDEILGRCNTRYHRVRLIVNKKWGPSRSTILQIYKQCVPPIFEFGSLLTITTSDTIISKIQRLQNKFIRLALCLPKYISVKLLVHVSNFEGVSGSEDFACVTLPTTPFNFQGKVWNFCHPTLLKITFKISVTPHPALLEKGQSQNYGALMNSNGLLTLNGLLSLKFLLHMTTFFIKENHFTTNFRDTYTPVESLKCSTWRNVSNTKILILHCRCSLRGWRLKFIITVVGF